MSGNLYESIQTAGGHSRTFDDSGIMLIDGNPVGTSLVSLGSQSDVVNADATVSITCDGTGHQVSPIIASPPDWMDDAGNIITPGLYCLLLYLGQTTPDTTPGLYLVAQQQNITSLIPIDVLGVGGPTIQNILALGSDDLPFAAAWTVFSTAADITGVALGAAGVARLAS